MKILKITFKNINNLKGEHESIRFDQEPLSSAGIFAITGPTGSGKSTLLDVITLSLFNKIPRYKKGISKKEIESLGSVVTHHTNDAYASVEYEIKGNRYTSEWRVAKNRNGAFKDYEMFLYDATGQPLDLKKSEVPAKNEALIGLKYDQFVKSIILSQGEFSRFLKAEQNERGQLLENITGTEIYRKIGRKVFEKQKETKLQLETKKEILDSFQTLSEETIEQINQEISDTKSKKEVQDKSIKQLSDNVQIKKELSLSKKSIEELSIVATSILAKKKDFQSSLAKLELHNKLAPVKDDIALFKDAENNRVKTEENLKDYNLKLENAKLGLKECLENMAALTKKEVTQENFLTIMRDFENEILALDKDIDNSKTKGLEIRERLNKQKANYPHELDNKPSLALAFIEDRMSVLNQSIKKSNLSIESNSSATKKQLKENQEQYNMLLLIKHEQEHVKESSEKIKQSTEKLKGQEQIIKEKLPLKEKSEKLVNSYKDQIITLEKRKEDALKIASLEQHRNNLTKGEECPLCGSTEHPFSIHNPDSEFSEIEKQISKVKTALEEQQTEIKKYVKILTECETSIKLITADLAMYKEQLKESEINLKSKTDLYPKTSDLAEDKIEASIKSLGSEITLLEESIEALEEIKIATELQISFKGLDAELKKYTEIKNLRTSKFDGAEIGPVTNDLQNSFQKHSTSITRLAEAIEKETKDLNRALNSLEKHKAKLQPKLESLGFKSIEEMSLNFLEENEANQIIQRENELVKQLTENETKLKSLQTNVTKLTKEDKVPERNLEELKQNLAVEESIREELIKSLGELTNQLKTDKENKERQKSQLTEITVLVKENEKWSLLNKMIGDSNGNKFANFSQGLTLQNLLVFANHRLKNLSDRYLLDKPKDGGPLRVVDMFQGNTHRAVSTLSGGESFLISLALALSLSDMASRNVSLESLFIDEGFGTLDQETLDVAMNTLEKLQSENQKMVGVISHVAALKERITVQIKLEKNAQGFSNIKVVQN